jgi:ribonuclease P protein subunit POP4
MMRTAKNLGRHELIGLHVTVLKGSNIELSGRVIDETMNTFSLLSQGKELMVPKAGRDFQFDLDGQTVTLSGNRISHRPEDRTKKVRG